MNQRSHVRHHLEHALLLGAAAVLRRLPPGSSAKLGRALSRLVFGLARSRRQILDRNLAAAFPEKEDAERRRIATACLDLFGSTTLEFVESVTFSREEIERRVAVAGVENLQNARSRGKGVFILSAHIGSWELGAIRAGLLGEPISPVVRPLDNPLLERELQRRRTRLGNRVISKRDAAREILRALRDRQTVAILIDQNVIAEEAIFVPFFGRPAATSPSLAVFQLKTDAAVVPVFTFPQGDGRYRLEFQTPILASEFEDPSADRAERVRRATARYMEVTEAAVRRQPEAWLWMHNRWRTRPEE
jgi:Kdo2-lipid IVA lauroyltransferase/acyltransferase